MTKSDIMLKCDLRRNRGSLPLVATQSVISLKDKIWFAHYITYLTTFILLSLIFGEPFYYHTNSIL